MWAHSIRVRSLVLLEAVGTAVLVPTAASAQGAPPPPPPAPPPAPASFPAAPPAPAPDADLVRRLEQDLPTDTEGTLVHGDLRLDNMLVTLTPAPAVAAVVDGHVTVSVFWQRSWGGWSQPGQLPDSPVTGIACASPAPGQLDLVALDAGGRVHHCTWTARQRAWSQWASLPAAGQPAMAISAASPGARRVAVAALAADGTARYCDYELRAPGRPQWSSWVTVG